MTCWFDNRNIRLFLGKLGPKNQNGQFKLKLDSKPNLSMQNSTVMFTFSVFDWKYSFWANLAPKFKIFKVKFCTSLIRICTIQWWCSLFSALLRKYPFWANLVQKVKIVSLSWNMVPRLIWLCRIQSWCSLSVFNWKYPFWVNFVQKKKTFVSLC